MCWGWSVMVCAFGLGVGGLGVVGRSLRLRVWSWVCALCFRVWGWWVGVGRSWLVLAGMAWVGWGRSGLVCALALVGWGWSVRVCA